MPLGVRSFLYDIMGGGSSKEAQDSFLFFVSLEEGLCPFLKFHFRECVVTKVLRIASLHKVLFKYGNIFFKCFV